ncbi:MAG: hypothetical protein AB2608_16005 [Candidatus Thiodiazotropha sp.]
MSKLIQAINVMVANESKIGRVTPGKESKEVFFVYDKKHVWSMAKQDSGMKMWYYPSGINNFEHLVNARNDEWEHMQMVYYSEEEFATREAKESVDELYRIVREKQYGMDEVFNDIFSSDETF